MNDIALAGCGPTPLANYLKALGVLRLVAAQQDPAAAGYWLNQRFVLRTALNEHALTDFFCNDYRPTPVIAPWNGGSGFYPKDNQDGIEQLSQSPSPRFAPYRAAILSGKTVLQSMTLEESPKHKDQKAKLLARLRAELSDEALAWLDAAVMLSQDETRYPPLLSTGGNDGRLDFTNNFMQRLTELFNMKSGQPQPAGQRWLAGALFGKPTPALLAKAVGQFSPGAVGGPNATIGFEAGSLVNPWDFVLMLEGALQFAAAATRRMASADTGGMSYPFTVKPTGSGAGNAAFADEGPARAEMWMPLWETPAGYGEIRELFAEGRAAVGRRPVKNGLDFVRAVAALGVDRGIGEFQRYGFFMRSGKAYLATPLSRFQVRRNAAVDLLSEPDVDRWLDTLRDYARREDAPGKLKSWVRRLENCIFDLTQQPETQRPVQQIMTLLSEVQRYGAISPKLREALRTPLPRLSEKWVLIADDRSNEFRLAVALAGVYASSNDPQKRFNMATCVAPVTADGRAWNESSRDVVWRGADLTQNLLAVLQRLLVNAKRLGLEDKPLFGRCPCDPTAVAAYLAGNVDEQRIAALIPALSVTRLPSSLSFREKTDSLLLPFAYSALKLIFTPDAELRRLNVLSDDASLAIPSGLLRQTANPATVDHALQLAGRRLRAANVITVPRALSAAGLEPIRLAASMLIPLRRDSAKETFKDIDIGTHTNSEPAP